MWFVKKSPWKFDNCCQRFDEANMEQALTTRVSTEGHRRIEGDMSVSKRGHKRIEWQQEGMV